MAKSILAIRAQPNAAFPRDVNISLHLLMRPTFDLLTSLPPPEGRNGVLHSRFQQSSPHSAFSKKAIPCNLCPPTPTPPLHTPFEFVLGIFSVQ